MTTKRITTEPSTPPSKSAKRAAPKAPNGAGSVFYDDREGRWIARIPLADGRRRKRRCATEMEAWRALDAMLAAEASGTLDTSNVSVAGVIDAYRAEVVPARERSHAWRVNQEWALALIEPRLGKRLLSKLSVGDVDSMLKRLGGSGYSRESLIKIRSVGGQVIEWALRRDLVHRNVFRHAELPAGAARTPERRSLTAAEARQLLDAIEDEPNAAMYLLALVVGLRPGELLGLTWHDVDLEHGVVHVRRSLKLEPNPEITESTKTEKSRRSLKLPEVALVALRKHRVGQAEQRLELGEAWGWRRDGKGRWPDLVFATGVGSPIRPENLRRSFARITTDAGLGRWVPYELRHSAVSLLSAAGVPLERIADVVGHDGIRMTGSVYRHAVSPTVDHAAAPMDELFGS